LGVLGCLLILLQTEYGEEAANFEKIGDVSPDKKFAVRIRAATNQQIPTTSSPVLSAPSNSLRLLQKNP
jgi:hypothetical protein